MTVDPEVRKYVDEETSLYLPLAISLKTGFLGFGESLREVIYNDVKTLQELGLTPMSVAMGLYRAVDERISDIEVEIIRYKSGQSDSFD